MDKQLWVVMGLYRFDADDDTDPQNVEEALAKVGTAQILVRAPSAEEAIEAFAQIMMHHWEQKTIKLADAQARLFADIHRDALNLGYDNNPTPVTTHEAPAGLQ